MDGILNILKPPGMTSHDVISCVRRTVGQKKVGHSGTLDPGAAGVLPICMGKATRLSDYVSEGTKRYLGEIVFGASTDTLDSYGKVVKRMDVEITQQVFEQTIAHFIGTIDQPVPLYSAVKLGGQPMYRSMHRGNTPTEQPIRKVAVYDWKLRRQTGKNRFLFAVECGKGTYIRALCEMVGNALGVPAYLSFLLREKVGEFSLLDAITLDELIEMDETTLLSPKILLPMEKAVSHLPLCRLSVACESHMKRGMREFDLKSFGKEWSSEDAEKIQAIYLEEEFVGLGKIHDGKVSIKKYLRREDDIAGIR